MKTLKQKLNKIFKDNPDFIFYDFENECVGKDLLDFISNLLQKRREEIVEMINKKEKRAKRMITDNPKYEYEAGKINGYNQAISDIIKTLTK